mmetsp:Transcript_64649/g.204088  ORF Transcript_64649/g.204088 Transcript_64649/m.204088 type:complete len:257 (-) Transcript_64649:161-931(-)
MPSPVHPFSSDSRMSPPHCSSGDCRTLLSAPAFPSSPRPLPSRWAAKSWSTRWMITTMPSIWSSLAFFIQAKALERVASSTLSISFSIIAAILAMFSSESGTLNSPVLGSAAAEMMFWRVEAEDSIWFWVLDTIWSTRFITCPATSISLSFLPWSATESQRVAMRRKKPWSKLIMFSVTSFTRCSCVASAMESMSSSVCCVRFICSSMDSCSSPGRGAPARHLKKSALLRPPPRCTQFAPLHPFLSPRAQLQPQAK